MGKGPNHFERLAETTATFIGVPKKDLAETVFILAAVNQISGVIAQGVFWSGVFLLEAENVLENRPKLINTTLIIDIFSIGGLAIAWGNIISVICPAIVLGTIKHHLASGQDFESLNYLQRAADGISMAYEQGYL